MGELVGCSRLVLPPCATTTLLHAAVSLLLPLHTAANLPALALPFPGQRERTVGESEAVDGCNHRRQTLPQVRSFSLEVGSSLVTPLAQILGPQSGVEFALQDLAEKRVQAFESLVKG
jgi:hypothetical protein